MTIARFARVHLVILPILLLVGYLYFESIPAIILVIGGAYVAFAGAITGSWWLSHLSLALEGD